METLVINGSRRLKGILHLQTYHVYPTLKLRVNYRLTPFQRGIHVVCLCILTSILCLHPCLHDSLKMNILSSQKRLEEKSTF